MTAGLGVIFSQCARKKLQYHDGGNGSMSMRKSNMSVCLAARATSTFVKVLLFGESMYALAVKSAMKTEEEEEEVRSKGMLKSQWQGRSI